MSPESRIAIYEDLEIRLKEVDPKNEVDLRRIEAYVESVFQSTDDCLIRQSLLGIVAREGVLTPSLESLALSNAIAGDAFAKEATAEIFSNVNLQNRTSVEWVKSSFCMEDPGFEPEYLARSLIRNFDLLSQEDRNEIFEAISIGHRTSSSVGDLRSMIEKPLGSD